MAESMWIKIDGVKGEATDDKHKDEIDIDSYSWGMSHPVDSGGTGHSAGTSSATQLVVSKTVDKATPNLMKNCLSAKPLGKVVLTCRKMGGTPIENLMISLFDAIVASVQDSGSGDGAPAQETVSFAFTKVEVEYTPQKEDGTADGSVKATWNFATNTE